MFSFWLSLLRLNNFDVWIARNWVTGCNIAIKCCTELDNHLCKVETERETVTEFAAQVVQVVKEEDADEGDSDADDEVQDYTNALLEGLAEVAVEWLTVALYCHYMERDDLTPHEDLLAAAVTGVFVAELNVGDGEEDDEDEESDAPEVEDDEDDDQYQ